MIPADDQIACHDLAELKIPRLLLQEDGPGHHGLGYHDAQLRDLVRVVGVDPAELGEAADAPPDGMALPDGMAPDGLLGLDLDDDDTRFV